jgi:hypothetical protein
LTHFSTFYIFLENKWQAVTLAAIFKTTNLLFFGSFMLKTEIEKKKDSHPGLCSSLTAAGIQTLK